MIASVSPSPPPPSLLTPYSKGSLVDATGAVWTLSPSGQVYVNSRIQLSGTGTLALFFSSPTMWGFSAPNSQWYSWSGEAWMEQPGQLPPGFLVPIPPFTLDQDLDFLLAEATTQVQHAIIISIQSLRRSPFGP